jgi:hypothetical protein
LGDAVCLLNPIAWPEPFGMVMIEALATGTPVIATACGSAPEIIDDGLTGYLADTPDRLTKALVSVADLDRSACRRAAEQRFSAHRMVADHVAIYRAVSEARELASYTKAHPKSVGRTVPLPLARVLPDRPAVNRAHADQAGSADTVRMGGVHPAAPEG